MAIAYFTGTADAVAQVTTVTVGGVLAGETFTLSVGGVAIASHTDADTVIATTVAALVSAWNASTHPYGTAVSAVDASPDITLTADTAGVPFTVTVNTPGGAATLVITGDPTTASAGPNDLSTEDNWTGGGGSGGKPAATDTVEFKDTDVDVCWGLTELNGVALDGLFIHQTYTGRMGLDYAAFATSADGRTVDTSKQEYRSTRAQFPMNGATKRFHIGWHEGPGTPAGSQQIYLLMDGSGEIIVHNTATVSSQSGRPSVDIDTTSASTNLIVREAPAGVGVAMQAPDDAATINDITVTSQSASTRVFIGKGVSWDNFTQFGGTNQIDSAIDLTAGEAVKVHSGTLTIQGDFLIDELHINGGLVIDKHLNTGAVSIVDTWINGGTLDLTQNGQAHELTNVYLEKGGTLRADDGLTDITNLLEPDGGTGPYTISVT